MTRNYCITGKAGSGKDTVGNYIAQHLGKDTYALAAPIKLLVAALLDKTVTELEDRRKKEKPDFYTVTVQSLDAAAIVYKGLGLEEYQDFHDAWEYWITLFRLKLTPWGTYETWLSPRHFLQLMGTEWGRGLDDQIWLKVTPLDVVVTDVRMDNEAQYFVDKGYTLVEVVRESQKAISSSDHLSEAGVDASVPRVVIYNDGSIDSLHLKLQKLLD